MNYLVKILTDEYGVPDSNNNWHFVMQESGASMALCNGQVFGYGSSSVLFETKTTSHGGITCPDCLDKIKKIKAIKL